MLLLVDVIVLPAGFCVELCVAAVIIVASRFGIPMS
jgi:phosphate/sulfate permease